MMLTVPAISLWQPWASLCVWGVKPWETRSWSTAGNKGLLAIHAAKRWRKDQEQWTFDLIHDALKWPDLPSELADELRFVLNSGPERELPRGAIVGTVQRGPVHATNVWQPPERYYMLGDFAPSRFAWEFHRPARLRKPLHWTGTQGFFNVEIPPAAIDDNAPVFWAPEVHTNV